MKNCRKILSLLLSIFVFTAMFMMNGSSIQNVQAAETNNVDKSVTEEEKSSDLPVQLCYAKYENTGYYGGAAHGYIRVKNLAYDKKVIVHYEPDYNKPWEDKNAKYVKTDKDGSEIWHFNISTKKQSAKFAIKYEVNGKTYWDNNNSKNYWVSYEYNEVQLGENNICLDLSSFNPDDDFYKFTANICVRNTNKKPTSVKVRYTEDNWKTYKEVVAEPKQGYGSEVLNYVAKTNDIEKTTKDIKYAVYSEVDGVEYCDDNFGSYYSGSVYDWS